MQLDGAKILVTGADGFVGTHLTGMIRARYPRAELLCMRREGAAGKGELVADLTVREEVAAVVAAAAPDLVVHLAGWASAGAAIGQAAAVWDVNLIGTLNLATAIAAHAPHATMLHVGTGDAYGLSFLEGPAGEDRPLQPVNAYARSKAAAEAVLADVYPADGRLIVARAFNHTGPGQDERFVVSNFAAQIARCEAGLQPPVIEVGNLEVEREILDVRDVARAYLQLIERAEALPDRSVFNICTGHPTSIQAMLDMLLGHARVELAVHQDPARQRKSEIQVVAGDPARIHALGWRAEIPLDQTLADVLDYQRGRVIAA